MNLNIDFQSVCLGTIFYSSTEITDFSWQVYFFLVNFKSEIWQIYVIRRHHCQSTRGSCLPLLIFSYKGISILYYSMISTLFFHTLFIFTRIWIEIVYIICSKLYWIFSFVLTINKKFLLLPFWILLNGNVVFCYIFCPKLPQFCSFI